MNHNHVRTTAVSVRLYLNEQKVANTNNTVSEKKITAFSRTQILCISNGYMSKYDEIMASKKK